jgi:hypothetical protein
MLLSLRHLTVFTAIYLSFMLLYSCIIRDLTVENVSKLNRIHIQAPCVNWSAYIVVTRTPEHDH